MVASRSGRTPDTSVGFSGLEAGTSARLMVRALPAEGDKTYKESPWSEPAEGEVESSGGGLPRLADALRRDGLGQQRLRVRGRVERSADATDYTYFVELPNGRTVATGKTWEPHVHVGGLAGKSLGNYPYFNFRVVANHMNYNSSKEEIPQTFLSSESSEAVRPTSCRRRPRSISRTISPGPTPGAAANCWRPTPTGSIPIARSTK